MARPREFDEDEVLERAMNAFWERGFEATSIADLERATGLVRTSLYGAFGGKEQLFTRVLERFGKRYVRFRHELLHGEPARAGFEAAFALWLSTNCQDDGPRGCLVQVAGSSGAGCVAPARALVDEAMAFTQQTMLEALRRAKKQKELRPRADLEALARYLIVGLQGLSSAARAGSSREDLEPVVALMIDTVFDKR